MPPLSTRLQRTSTPHPSLRCGSSSEVARVWWTPKRGQYPPRRCSMATRKRHTKEFKLEAVRLLAQSGRPGAEVARELGIRRNQLYKWATQLKGKGRTRAFLGSGPRRAAED